MYTREQVIEKSTEYFNGDTLAATVFADKYALKSETGEYVELTPDDMHKRLAKEFARIENKYPNSISEQDIYDSIKEFKYIVPQGSPMAGIGNENQIMSVSNCFVIGSPEDSYGGIMKADEEIAQLSKRRAGIGLDISNIRPKGQKTKNAANTTDGISVFMDRFSNTCREVAQGGRRGAEMQSISVHHPEVETFIKIKKDKKRVTGANISVKLTEEFMNAVKNNEEYEQRWPVDSKNPKISKMVSAKKIWDMIIESAWESAEPGILFWDNIEKYTPSESYEDCKAVSVNPCIVGDTMVYVADGRGLVSIKDLTEQNKDVDVFCYDNDNNIVIKKMRNPRITGYDQKILKITFDDGNSIRTTENHKFMLKSGEYIEAKDLKKYDQLKTLTRYEDTICNFFKKQPKNKSLYYWLTTDKKPILEHRVIARHNHGNIDGLVIHHKDFKSTNNSPENLIPMTRQDHDIYHGECIRGDKNPMRRAATEWSQDKWDAYSLSMSMAISGLQNGRAYNVTNEEIKERSIELTKKLGRRFSRSEWYEFAKENSLPMNFSNFRQMGGFKTIYELGMYACNQLGIENQIHDTRLLKTVQLMEEQGYNCKIENNEVLVEKFCENCGESFYISHLKREQSFCSVDCSLQFLNSQDDIQKYRVNSTIETYKSKQNKNRIKILDAYTKLKVDLGRDPLSKELHEYCKQNNISYRLYTRFGFKSYQEIKDAALSHNHRVVSVEFDGYETVYNGTVDDYHNFFVGGFKQNDSKNSLVFLNNKQCGEIILPKYDSCRLICMNVLNFVDNPYTTNSTFNYEKFKSYCKLAQRLMDDLVDIELEQIDKILAKIQSDPESDEIKFTEINLWNKIKHTCAQGRRTGLGVTAIGDTLAALGILYGSNDSIKMVENIYKEMAIAAYESSIDMAEERGHFPRFERDVEFNNEFIQRIYSELSTDYKNKYDTFGRRNIALTTTSPTGSVSIVTRTSSGIEPVFLLSYDRRKKINPSENIEADYIDSVGDKWKTYKIYHHELKNWMNVTGKNEISESPWFGATSQEIDWEKSVDLQAAAQKWVCHSISKTCNLPSTATKELVANVYMKAWETGCKGFTVYRDGCRDGVLVTNDKKEIKKDVEIIETNSPKRPETLECDIHHMKVKGENWIVLVGKLNDKPYEVFAGLSKFVSIPKKISTGKIIKKGSKKENGSSIYNLIYGDENDPTIIKDIVNVFENATEGAWTRLVSFSLRHGGPIQHIVQQLNKDDHSDMYSFSKVIARVLKIYIKDGTKIKSKCPNCGGENLIYQEGCLSCQDCSYSKC